MQRWEIRSRCDARRSEPRADHIAIDSLDGVEPEVLDEVRSVSSGTDGVKEVAEVRVRWLGHRMVAEVNIAVDPDISVEKGHDIAQEVHHSLLHHLRYLSSATIHVDPEAAARRDGS